MREPFHPIANTWAPSGFVPSGLQSEKNVIAFAEWANWFTPSRPHPGHGVMSQPSRNGRPSSKCVSWRSPVASVGTGNGHSFGGTYLDLVPHERIRYTDTFDDPGLPGEMVTTVTIRAVSCGTELHVVQEGIPEVIPPEACHLGWQESLDHLARLVEPEIPDA
jgi:hypothetical protein